MYTKPVFTSPIAIKTFCFFLVFSLGLFFGWAFSGVLSSLMPLQICKPVWYVGTFVEDFVYIRVPSAVEGFGSKAPKIARYQMRDKHQGHFPHHVDPRIRSTRFGYLILGP